MSNLVPRPAAPFVPDREPTAPLIDRLRQEDRLRRWEVRAAQWRALELAEEAFGPGVGARLVSLRTGGTLRGLLCLEVPFGSLGEHRMREAAFMASVGTDALLSTVPLVYVLGPGEA